MCDQATKDILDQVVSDFIRDRFIFTALNVSREAQKNRGVTLRHLEMKNEVHRNYADGQMEYDDNGSTRQFERRLVTIPGIRDQVWAYYPEGVNPDNYDLTALKDGPIDTKDAAKGTTGAPTAPPQSVPVPTYTPPTTGGTASPFANSGTVATATAPAAQGKHSLDARKRLWLPRQLLRDIGLSPGREVDAIADGKSIIVAPKGKRAGTVVTSYLIDGKGNVALSKMVFDYAKLNGSSFDVLHDHDTVVVKQP